MSDAKRPDDGPNADAELGSEISEAELSELVEHLQSEEEAAREATLSSAESFQMWVMTHPALRQMALVENIAQLAPAIMTVLRRLLGM